MGMGVSIRWGANGDGGDNGNDNNNCGFDFRHSL